MIIRNFDTTLTLNTQLSEVIAALEVIGVKGVNDDTQSMIMRNEVSECRGQACLNYAEREHLRRSQLGMRNCHAGCDCHFSIVNCQLSTVN